MAANVSVFKFGSSVLRSERDLPVAVREIAVALARGERVLAVVSAFGNATDRLLRRARRHAEAPAPGALASLLATGEAVSAALLGIALDRAGIRAAVFDPAQIRLSAVGDPLDARPCGVDARRLDAALARRVAVVPGFVGRGPDGAPVLLGRGGSDYTAFFLAARLGARSCVLFKDVDGLYTSDPGADRAAARYETATWRTARERGGAVVQPKAVLYAEGERLAFEITAPGADASTRVGPGPDRLAEVRAEEVCA
jgi:homoserine dehydrogenase